MLGTGTGGFGVALKSDRLKSDTSGEDSDALRWDDDFATREVEITRKY